MKRTLLAVLVLAAALGAQVFDGPEEPAISPVPEPTTYLLMAAGLGAIAFSRHRFTRKK